MHQICKGILIWISLCLCSLQYHTQCKLSKSNIHRLFIQNQTLIKEKLRNILDSWVNIHLAISFIDTDPIHCLKFANHWYNVHLGATLKTNSFTDNPLPCHVRVYKHKPNTSVYEGNKQPSTAK